MESLFLSENAWKLLAVIGVCLAVAEIFVPGFVLLPIGLGFLITALVGLWITQWTVLLIILAASQVLTFFVFKNLLKKQTPGSGFVTNVDGMIGQECVVTETIEPHGAGYVKLYADLWQAKSDCGRTLTPGTRVLISRIDGNKVWVDPL